ncbi:MAG: hypothetical protein WKF30_18845 [Pyrinomonadaceae bacterium]
MGGYLMTSDTAPQHIDDHSIRLTFWTAGAITLIAFFLAVHFARTQANKIPLNTELETPGLEVSSQPR